MAVKMFRLPSLLMLVTVISAHGASSLECFSCVDYERTSSDYSLPNIDRYPACGTASILGIGSVPTETCGPDEACSALKGEMVLEVEPTPDTREYISYNIVLRQCLPKFFHGCAESEHNDMRAVQKLSEYIGHPVVKYHGEMCFCHSDYCAAVSCSQGYANMFGYCVDWWLVLCMVLALSLLLMLIIVPIIRCCCRSKSKPTKKMVWTADHGHVNQEYKKDTP